MRIRSEGRIVVVVAHFDVLGVHVRIKINMDFRNNTLRGLGTDR